jgi:hypothetical protein
MILKLFETRQMFTFHCLINIHCASEKYTKLPFFKSLLFVFKIESFFYFYWTLEHLQQVEDNVWGFTWQLEKVKTMYRFLKIMSEVSHDNWKRSLQPRLFHHVSTEQLFNYGLCQSVLVRKRMMEKRFFSLLSLTKMDNEWVIVI